VKKQYVVRLSKQRRDQLYQLVSAGTAQALKLTRARILLAADDSKAGPALPDAAIAEALQVGRATVERVRTRFCREGLEAALNRRKQAHHRAPRLDGEAEAHLIALACSEPPAGRGRWSLRLLADRMVTLEYVDRVSHECVRQTLKRGRSSRG
jgi:transposase